MTRAKVRQLAESRNLDALYALQERAYDAGNREAEEFIERLILEVIEAECLENGSHLFYGA